MASVASPASQAHSSRRRGGTNAKEATTEDQALNMIAREAEARLAAKRAARAEARSIRMKEIERKQKEADDDEGNSEDNEPPDDSMYSKRAGRMSSPTLSAYDIPDTVPPSMQVTNDAQVIQLKESVKEADVKYKKAMVNAAQLDNERQALQYQVEVLKDIIEELQQKIENTDDELLHKCREYNKLSREHNNTTGELTKCLFLLEERERVLDENGINIDGTIKEGYTPQTSSALCSQCSVSLNEDLDTVDGHRERGSLLAEISSLKSEIEDLQQTSNSEHSRRELESTKTERVELEQSFADVSNEAAVIREDALHAGLYVNNNEKNDDFEMIDDGSQQGGIRHFEDQSFEKSTSSLTSSMLTDAMMSMESSVPLEISVDNISKPVPKDDYDIVQVEDTTTKTANINVDSYTSLEFLPSISSSSGGDTSSNININKYLFDDHDDTLNDDSDQYSTFCVDRYFSTESTTHNVDIDKQLDHIHHIDEHNELQTSVDTITNVQSDYDTIDTEDLLSNPDSPFVSEENRDSPYEDVQVESIGIPRSSDGMVIIEESKTSDKISFDETSVESSDMRPLKVQVLVDTRREETPVFETDTVVDFAVSASVQIPSDDPSEDTVDHSSQQVITVEDVSLQMVSPDDFAVSSNYTEDDMVQNGDDMSQNGDEMTRILSRESEISMLNEVTICGVETVDVESRTSFAVDAGGTDEQDSISMSINMSTNSSMNTAFCIEDVASVGRVESITETDKIAIRNDVEELYNQIADETNAPLVTIEEGHDIQRTPSGKIVTGDGENKGWLVHVESYTAPQLKAPEINIVDIKPQVNLEPMPEPKERKKKKKKKKNEKTDEVSVVHLQETPPNIVMPSDPLLLGFAPEPDGEANPSEKSTEKTARPKSDIPKQFLDASAELIDNSYSDASDIEDGEIGEDGKKKSSKRSKKEGCKSQ